MAASHRKQGGYLLAVTVMTLVASACTPGSTDSSEPTVVTTTTIPTTTTTLPPPSTTTTEPLPYRTPGGSVVVGEDQEPSTLNVFIPGGDSLSAARIGQAYLAGVQDIDGESLELIPDLVEELPTVANGGVTVNADGTMTVRYRIEEDATWSDGVPITGEDFQFTLETILDRNLPISRTTYEGITLSGYSPKTFEYTLARPTVQYELLFNAVIPKHAVAGTDFLRDWNDRMWPSAGPFVFKEWARGEYLSVARNDHYWKHDPETRQPLPYLDEVIFKFIPETEQLLSAFREREIDVIQPPPSIETIALLRELEPDGAEVQVRNGPYWEQVAFQFGPERFTRNPDSCSESVHLRRAVALAIDRTVLTNEIFAGLVEPLDSYVAAYRPALSHDNWAQYEPDPAAAQDEYLAAVAETGKQCAVVFTTTENNDERVQMAALLTEMFAEAGIPYTNDLEDRQLFVAVSLINGSVDVAEWAWIGSPGLSGLVGSYDLFDPDAPPPGGSNYYRWGTEGSAVVDEATARFAEIRDAVNATVDEAELIPLFAEGEKILADNVVTIPLYARPVTAAVWADTVGGYVLNPTQAADTWNMELWYRIES